jgi:hypothetical protein
MCAWAGVRDALGIKGMVVHVDTHMSLGTCQGAHVPDGPGGGQSVPVGSDRIKGISSDPKGLSSLSVGHCGCRQGSDIAQSSGQHDCLSGGQGVEVNRIK